VFFKREGLETAVFNCKGFRASVSYIPETFSLFSLGLGLTGADDPSIWDFLRFLSSAELDRFDTTSLRIALLALRGT